MRIAYVCYWNAFRNDGVTYKINDQVRRWREMGHEARVFCLSAAPAERGPAVFDGPIYTFSGRRERPLATLRLAADVRRHAPTCVYMRDDLFLPPLGRTLRSGPSAIEINGDLSEFRSRRAARLYARATYAVTLRSAAGLVFVSHELSRSPDFAVGRGKPSIVIANGADPERVRHLPAPSNERPRLILLAAAATVWQGLDKVLWLAEHMPEADFELVGPRATDLPAPLPPNVTAHGMLSHEEYEPILARSDVALGTLALHRVNRRENPALKVREYLLAGLPVINGCEDTDFRSDRPWYLLELPNTEGNVRENVPEIRAFVASMRGRRVPREQVVQRVGNAAKEAARLEFLAALVRQGG